MERSSIFLSPDICAFLDVVDEINLIGAAPKPPIGLGRNRKSVPRLGRERISPSCSLIVSSPGAAPGRERKGSVLGHLEGVLLKKKSRGIHQRYVILCRNVLEWRLNKTADSKHNQSITLVSSADVETCTLKGKPAFKILFRSGKYSKKDLIFAHESPSLRDTWFKSIQETIQNLRESEEEVKKGTGKRDHTLSIVLTPLTQGSTTGQVQAQRPAQFDIRDMSAHPDVVLDQLETGCDIMESAVRLAQTVYSAHRDTASKILNKVNEERKVTSKSLDQTRRRHLEAVWNIYDVHATFGRISKAAASSLETHIVKPYTAFCDRARRYTRILHREMDKVNERINSIKSSIQVQRKKCEDLEVELLQALDRQKATTKAREREKSKRKVTEFQSKLGDELRQFEYLKKLYEDEAQSAQAKSRDYVYSLGQLEYERLNLIKQGGQHFNEALKMQTQAISSTVQVCESYLKNEFVPGEDMRRQLRQWHRRYGNSNDQGPLIKGIRYSSKQIDSGNFDAIFQPKDTKLVSKNQIKPIIADSDDESEEDDGPIELEEESVLWVRAIRDYRPTAKGHLEFSQGEIMVIRVEDARMENREELFELHNQSKRKQQTSNRQNLRVNVRRMRRLSTTITMRDLKDGDESGSSHRHPNRSPTRSTLYPETIQESHGLASPITSPSRRHSARISSSPRQLVFSPRMSDSKGMRKSVFSFLTGATRRSPTARSPSSVFTSFDGDSIANISQNVVHGSLVSESLYSNLNSSCHSNLKGNTSTPRMMSSREAFEFLRSSEEGMALLRHRLKEEMSSENLDFVLAVEKYEETYDGFLAIDNKLKEKDLHRLSGRAQFIYETFVAADSPNEVNLQGNVRIQVSKDLEENKITKNMFHRPKAEIEKLIVRDSMVRLMTTPEFRALAGTEGELVSEIFYFGYVVGDPKRAGLIPRQHVEDVRDQSSTEIPAKQAKTPKHSRGASWNLASLVMGSRDIRRFRKGSFDLDLCYVTDRIIAMGDASDINHPQYDLKRYLDQRYKDHYMVIELRAGRGEGRFLDHMPTVYVHGIKDQDVVPFSKLLDICQQANKWLEADEKNIVAITCNTGNGRTGMVVSSLICHRNKWFTAARAMRLFAVQRLVRKKGVKNPSQRLYVQYYERYCTDRKSISDQRPLDFLAIKMQPIPSCCADRGVFFIMSISPSKPKKTQIKWDSRELKATCHRSVEDYLRITPLPPIGIDGDVRIEVFTKGMFKTKLFGLCFNTRFPPTHGDGSIKLVMSKKRLENACNDIRHRIFSEEFVVEVSLKETT